MLLSLLSFHAVNDFLDLNVIGKSNLANQVKPTNVVVFVGCRLDVGVGGHRPSVGQCDQQVRVCVCRMV